VSNDSNLAVFEGADFETFQVQSFVSDYVVRSVLEAIYTPNVTLISSDLPITTTELSAILIGNRLHKHGWDLGMPCTVDI